MVVCDWVCDCVIETGRDAGSRGFTRNVWGCERTKWTNARPQACREWTGGGQRSLLRMDGEEGGEWEQSERTKAKAWRTWTQTGVFDRGRTGRQPRTGAKGRGSDWLAQAGAPVAGPLTRSEVSRRGAVQVKALRTSTLSSLSASVGAWQHAAYQETSVLCAGSILCTMVHESVVAVATCGSGRWSRAASGA